MTNTQTTTAKPNFLSAFTKFQPTVGFDPKPFEQLGILIPGVQGCGKTSLVSTAPDVLRLDFDGARDNNPNSVGTNIRFDQGPTDYLKLVEVVETLEKLSVENKPRPNFICFDTMDTFLESVKQFVVFNARQKNPNRQILTIDDLPGGYGWNKVYEHAEPIITRLFAAGYGVILFCYFYEETYTVTNPATGQESVMVRYNHTIPPKFWQKIKGKVDYVAGLGQRTVVTPVYGAPRKDGNGNILKDGSGNPICEIVRRDKSITRFIKFVENEREDTNNTIKQRIPLPDEITLPAHPKNPKIPAPGNFDLIRQAYNQGKAEIAKAKS